MNEEEQCRAEIANVEALLRSGHPDVQGLCLALSDWSAELRLISARREACRLQNGSLYASAEAIYGRGPDSTSGRIAGHSR